MTTMDQLAALAWEARRRGITYGELSAQLEPGEDLTICDRYRQAMREEAKKRAAERERQRGKKGRR